MAIAYAKLLLCSSFETQSTEYRICSEKVNKLIHPDLHFVYPVNTNENIKKNPIANSYIDEWRSFVKTNPYASQFEWFQLLGIEKKQGNISVKEAEDIAKKMSLKPYEGGYKVMIVWMADRMNTDCANKILKLLEEPPEKTVILLLTEDEKQLLSTIRSRCQKLNFPKLAEAEIAEALVEKFSTGENTAFKISRQAQGDFNRAIQIVQQGEDDNTFERSFIAWVRTAFRAKGNKQAINELLEWSETLAGIGREPQKRFLAYCIEVFRQALLKNYTVDSLLYYEAEDLSFSLEKFSPFIHQNNIFEIIRELEEASYHIERNGNPKIIFTDLSIKLTRLFHKSEAA